MVSRGAGQCCKGAAEAINGAYIRRHRPSHRLHRYLRGQDKREVSWMQASRVGEDDVG